MKRLAIGLVALLVLVVVAGGAFYGGMKVGQNQVLKNPMQYLQQGGGPGGPFVGQQGQGRTFRGTPQPGQGGVARFGGDQVYTVESVEGNTVVVSTGDETVRVLTTDTTLIQKYTTVSTDELEVGEQVIVSGSKNEDGSISARSIRSMSGFQFDAQEQPTEQP